jgi:hypothetical protein
VVERLDEGHDHDIVGKKVAVGIDLVEQRREEIGRHYNDDDAGAFD